MHRFLSTTAIAGAALAVALIGTPASAAPDAAAAPTGTYTLAKPLPLPSPPPPRIPPPRCVPQDQTNNNYEWRYSKTKKLGSKDRGFRVSHEFLDLLRREGRASRSLHDGELSGRHPSRVGRSSGVRPGAVSSADLRNLGWCRDPVRPGQSRCMCSTGSGPSTPRSRSCGRIPGIDRAQQLPDDPVEAVRRSGLNRALLPSALDG
jgi:hypothetical protein